MDRCPPSQFEIIDKSDGGILYLEHGSPSDFIRWHAHEPYELHLIVSTKGQAFIGDYIGHYEPGQLVLTGPHVPHNWVSDEVSPPVLLRDMCILFSRESIDHIIEGFPEAQGLLPMLELSASGIEFIGFDKAIAEDLFAQVRDKRGIERLSSFLVLLEKLSNWTEKRALSTAQVAPQVSGVVKSKVSEVVKYITEHYQDELSLKQVADLVSMSESSFSRHFQRETRSKFVEFVNRVRVSKACIMLAETDERISSICFDVGFNNITNFNRQFVRLKGQTPGEYRKVVQSQLGGFRV